MKAIRFHEYGLAEVLRYEDAPKPEPAPGHVLVQIHATSVNPVDCVIRAGYLRSLRELVLPFIPGWDFSGVVEAVGANCTQWKVGDEVFGHPDIAANGTYAEYIAVPESVCARKPPTIDHVHAAAIPLAALTAWQALFEHARLASGDKVLIQGGAGGVGAFAIQFAKLEGIRVAATASGRNQDFLRELGADEPIDYETTRFEDVVRDADAVIEAVGGETRTRSLHALKKGGIMVALTGPMPPAEPAEALGVRQMVMWLHQDQTQLTEIARLVDAGSVRVEISEVIPLTEAVRAHKLSETRRVKGKIVLIVR